MSIECSRSSRRKHGKDVPQIVHKETAVAVLSDKFSQTALVSTLVVKPCATHAIQDLEGSLVDKSEMSSVGSASAKIPPGMACRSVNSQKECLTPNGLHERLSDMGKAGKSFGKMVARDGIEPPTPAFSVLLLQLSI